MKNGNKFMKKIMYLQTEWKKEMNIKDNCTEKRNKELDKRRDKRESLECNENMVS